jgi:hypothetical protein
MNRGKDIRLTNKHVWKHSNVNKTKKYPSEDIMSVGGDGILENKDKASLSLKQRIFSIVSLLGYIISLSSFIQKLILLFEDSTVNLQTIITCVIGLVLQLFGLIMFHYIRLKVFEASYCDCCTHEDNLCFFAFSNIRLILSILEIPIVIFLKSDDFEIPFVLLFFIIFALISGTFYLFSILSSISFLATGFSASESQ